MTQIPGQESGKVMQKSTVRGIGQEDGNSTAGLKYFLQARFILEMGASHLQLGALAVLPTNEPSIPGGCRDLGRDHCSLRYVPERKVQHLAFSHRATLSQLTQSSSRRPMQWTRCPSWGDRIQLHYKPVALPTPTIQLVGLLVRSPCRIYSAWLKKTMSLPGSQSALCSPVPWSPCLWLLPSDGNSFQNLKPPESAGSYGYS